MEESRKIILIVAILVIFIGALFIFENFASTGSMNKAGISIHVNGEEKVILTHEDFKNMKSVSFVDNEEGKTQKGPYLINALSLKGFNNDYFKKNNIQGITVKSSLMNEETYLPLAKVSDKDEYIILAITGRGTRKLVGKNIPRAQWVKDITSIELVSRKPVNQKAGKYIIAIYLNGGPLKNLSMTELESLKAISFNATARRGIREQKGPLLKDVIAMAGIEKCSRIEVFGRESSYTIGWKKLSTSSAILDFTNSGEVKLTAPDGFFPNGYNDWVKDVYKINVDK